MVDRDSEADRESESAIDLVDKLFLTDDSGSLTYSPDGDDYVELAYKIHMMQLGRDQDQSETYEDLINNTWDIEMMTLARIYNDMIEILSEIDDLFDSLYDEDEDVDMDGFRQAKEDYTTVQLSDKLLVFYSLANEIIRGLMGDIMFQRVFDEDRSGGNAKNFARDIDSETQEDLLYYMGVIDEGEKGEIVNVRKTRNKLVHDIRVRQYHEGIDNIESMIDRAATIVDKLHEKAHGKKRLDV